MGDQHADQAEDGEPQENAGDCAAVQTRAARAARADAAGHGRAAGNGRVAGQRTEHREARLEDARRDRDEPQHGRGLDRLRFFSRHTVSLVRGIGSPHCRLPPDSGWG